MTDTDAAPIAEAMVTSAGPQGVRSDLTNRNGRFIFRDLVPGPYSVKVEAAGYATMTQTDVRVSLGSRTQLPFAMVAGMTEQITVTSEAPMVDLKNTSVGATVSVDGFVDYIPLDRTFSAMIKLAPSVVSGIGTGPSNYAISGSSGFENAYRIDGVNITNSGYGAFGSYNRIYQSIGPGVTNDFIDQVEIKTGGFGAEFGQATGGVVNAVVKSGNNAFAGQLSAFAEPSAFEAPRKLLNHLNAPYSVSVLETSRLDVGANFGGPFIRNKLFWFLAYNPVETETTYIRNVQDENELCVGNDCSRDWDGDGEYPDYRDPEQTSGGRTETNQRINHNYAAKLSWFAHPNHRIELTAFGDPSEGEFGAQRSDSLYRPGEQAFSELEYGNENYSLKYSAALTRSLFLNAMAARHDAEFVERGAPLYAIWDSIGDSFGTVTGGLGFLDDTNERVDQVALSLTVVSGNHEIKLGYQRDDTEYGGGVRLTGPAYFARLPVATYDTSGEPVWNGDYFHLESTSGAYLVLEEGPDSPSGLSYNTQQNRFSPSTLWTKNEESSLFFQDIWSVSPRLTLNLGLRWTRQYVAGGTPFALPFKVVRREGSTTKMVDPTLSTVYEPTSNTFPAEWAPRIGLSWDLRGDGRHKLYASYGRYVQRMTQDLAVRAFSNTIRIVQSWADSELLVPYDYGECPVGDDLNEPCQSVLGGLPEESDTSVIWNGTRLPKTDEFLVGYGHAINPTISVDVRYVHRELREVIEDFSYIPVESQNNVIWGATFGTFPFDPYPEFPGDIFGNNVLANVGKDSKEAAIQQAVVTGSTDVARLWVDGTISDFPEPTRDYDAIELVFNKRMSQNWIFFAAYRYARLFGDYEGLFRNDNGQADPNITTLYDYPNTPLMRGQFLSGRLNTDAEHKLSVYGTYQFPFGLNVGGGMSVVSGIPRFPLLAHPDGAFMPRNGDVPGADPTYASWVALNGDYDNLVLALAHGMQTPLSESTDGTLDANGQLVFTSYTPSPSDEVVPHPFPDFIDTDKFLYSYTPVTRDCCSRTPAQVSVDLHLGYDLRLGQRSGTLSLILDAFNIFNSQEGEYFDDVLEFERGEPNPDLGKAFSYQEPRLVRIGVRWTY